MDKFWMCYVSGTEGTRKRYEAEADARAEAERLARQTGKPTYLLENVAVCFTTEPPVKWEEA